MAGASGVSVQGGSGLPFLILSCVLTISFKALAIAVRGFLALCLEIFTGVGIRFHLCTPLLYTPLILWSLLVWLSNEEDSTSLGMMELLKESF